MLYKVNAIVLGGKDIGEADKIITLYSKERGKIKAVAKGVRKMKSKFGSSLEPFILSSLLIYSKNDSIRQTRPTRGIMDSSLDIVSDAQIQDSFRNLRKDIAGLAYGNFLVELVCRMTGEGESGGHKIFHLLREFLSLGEELKNMKVLIYGFTLRFFSLSGYCPQLEECVGCGSTLVPKVGTLEVPKVGSLPKLGPLEGEGEERDSSKIKAGKELNFSVNQGGILCNVCKEKDRGALPISISSLQYLRQLMKMGSRYLKNLKISLYCEEELESIVQDYFNFYLERSIESLSFFKQITEAKCHI